MHITKEDFNDLEDCTSFEIRAARKYNNQIANQLTSERIKAEQIKKSKNEKSVISDQKSVKTVPKVPETETFI
jgi:hypothetical protein